LIINDKYFLALAADIDISNKFWLTKVLPLCIGNVSKNIVLYYKFFVLRLSDFIVFRKLLTCVIPYLLLKLPCEKDLFLKFFFLFTALSDFSIRTFLITIAISYSSYLILTQLDNRWKDRKELIVYRRIASAELICSVAPLYAREWSQLMWRSRGGISWIESSSSRNEVGGVTGLPGNDCWEPVSVWEGGLKRTRLRRK